MSPLLDLIYSIGLLLVSPWIVYRIARSGEWRSLRARFGAGLEAPRGAIWLHGSSAGEVSLLKPLVALLENDLPDTPLIVSTYTTTGHAAAKRAYPRHRVFFFPVDLSFIVRRVLRRLDPRAVVIVESEFWPNFLLAARALQVPVVVLNGRMSERSCRAFARFSVLSRVLGALDLIAVQTAEHAERIRRLGVPEDRVHVTGNMKYDLACSGSAAGERHALRERLGYRPDDVVVIGGSLHPGEPEALLAACSSLNAGRQAALILVPRYPADADGIRQKVAEAGLASVCKTEIDRGRAHPLGASGVLIVDTVGELQALYASADIAFVGGSLLFRGSNKGGHNLMEPAILGLPVLFGPYNFSFKETVEDLLRHDAGVMVRDATELGGTLAELVGDRERRRSLGERARRVVLDGQGATQRNYALVLGVLGERPERLQPQVFERTMPRASGQLDSR